MCDENDNHVLGFFKDNIGHIINEQIATKCLRSRHNYGSNTTYCILIAGEYSSFELMKKLFINGAKTNVQDDSQETILHKVCRSSIDTQDKLRYLLQNGHDEVQLKQTTSDSDSIPLTRNDKVNVNTQTSSGLTALHIASQMGNENTVKYLLDQDDININLVDTNSKTANHYAVNGNHLEIYRMIRAHRSYDRSIVNKEGNTADQECTLNTSLHAKALLGSLEDVERLIKEGAFCIEDQVMETPLHKACRSKESTIDKIKQLVDYDSSQLNASNKNGYLPLHLAAKHDDPNVFKYVLAYYGIEKVNASTRNGLTSLHIASFYGLTDNVNALLERPGIYVNALDSKGNTSLHLASAKPHIEIIRNLKKHPICLDSIQNKNGLTADQINPLNKQLLQATESSTCKDVEILLDKGAFCTADINGNTPLHRVCFTSKEALKKATILIEADRTQLLRYNNKGRQPVHTAADENCIDLFKLFLGLEHSNEQSRKGRSLLHIAAKKGFTRIIEELLKDKSLDVNAQDAKGNTPAHLAAIKNHQETLKAIRKSTSYLDLFNKSGKSADDVNPLNKAIRTMCRDGTSSALDLMLKEGAKCLKDELGNTLLHIACTSAIESNEKCRLLLEHEPSLLNEANDKGNTPLLNLARSNNIKTAEYLLGLKGINVNKKNKDGNSPLHEAWSAKNVTMVTKILANPDVDINSKNKFRKDLLHLSAIQNDIKLCLLLLSHKDIDVNSIDPLMQTTLHITVQKNQVELARALLAHPDINLDIVDVDGNTALRIAEKFKLREIECCIRNHPSISLEMQCFSYVSILSPI